MVFISCLKWPPSSIIMFPIFFLDTECRCLMHLRLKVAQELQKANQRQNEAKPHLQALTEPILAPKTSQSGSWFLDSILRTTKHEMTRMDKNGKECVFLQHLTLPNSCPLPCSSLVGDRHYQHSTFRSQWPNLPTRRNPRPFPRPNLRRGDKRNEAEGQRTCSKQIGPVQGIFDVIRLPRLRHNNWTWVRSGVSLLFSSSHSNSKHTRNVEWRMMVRSWYHFGVPRLKPCPHGSNCSESREVYIGRINHLVCIAMQHIISKDGKSTTSFSHKAM